eukprot:CAMPEP_0202898760 /NCGR_PEP_ID=MMETSP1392-20130828/7192_1 /ASSEMBLY_ACC=CAM_ASM_000868 /TAXON_ID=225041 /ORGANISM="Chlamydomonas chlamydogama, Strain SAG 11-48b" /LENGTH=191 /DNA_ID=CAMNT_0049584777 /DNA_START=237 /DNA_END=811 /DNA_ORIENTATION=+
MVYRNEHTAHPRQLEVHACGAAFVAVAVAVEADVVGVVATAVAATTAGVAVGPGLGPTAGGSDGALQGFIPHTHPHRVVIQSEAARQPPKTRVKGGRYHLGHNASCVGVGDAIKVADSATFDSTCIPAYSTKVDPKTAAVKPSTATPGGRLWNCTVMLMLRLHLGRMAIGTWTCWLSPHVTITEPVVTSPW